MCLCVCVCVCVSVCVCVCVIYICMFVQHTQMHTQLRIHAKVYSQTDIIFTNFYHFIAVYMKFCMCVFCMYSYSIGVITHAGKQSTLSFTSFIATYDVGVCFTRILNVEQFVFK